jgi:hypothetical protein
MFGFIKNLFGTAPKAETTTEVPYKVEKPFEDTSDIALAQRPIPVAEAPKAEAPKAEAPKAEAPKAPAKAKAPAKPKTSPASKKPRAPRKPKK